MTPNDFADFETVLRAFGELKGKQLSTAAIELYWRAMADWSIEDFRAAATRLLKTAKFFPTAADFEELRKLASTATDGEAWQRARAHARDLPMSGGFLQEIPSGDEDLDRVVRCIGGYRAIAGASERDLQFLQQRFNEHRASTFDARAAREALPGLCSAPSGVVPPRLRAN